jgi:transposase
MSLVVLSTAAENEQLRSALDERDAKLVERDAKNQALRAQVITQREEIKALKKDLRLLASELEKFIGKRRGDGHLIDDGQLSLFGDVGPQEPEREETPDQAKEAPDGETPDDKIRNRHKPKSPARRIDMSLLARTVVVHELAEAQRICPDTGVLLVPIGERVFEELDFIVATLQVVEHRQIEYGPSPEVAKERQIDSVVAPLPPRPLEGCRASAALLAHMLILKYMLHMPLYRQETVFKQAGLSIPRQTLCDWVLKAAFALRPIARAIEASIRAGPVLQLDDTPVKCQAGKGQGNFQAYLWTFVNPDIPGVAFRFTEGRSTKDIAPLLIGAEAAILLGDAYAGNKSAAREAGLDVRHAGCWAHVVRKFKDACKEAPSMVGLFRGDLKALYNVEDEALDLGLDAEQRARLRQEKARPIIARLLRRTLGWKETFSLSGSMAAAIKYLRNSRRALTTYLDDGCVPIDNNACERSIRPVAIGRRNWLFAGSVRGGEAAAVVYSLVESCKISDVDPEAYLTDVLVRVATHPAADVGELVPSRWAAVRAAKT